MLGDLKDPEKVKAWVRRNQQNLKAWAAFLAVVFVLFVLFSDGDFSFVMTLGSLISMFAFLMVAVQIETSKSCSGVSLKMYECYVVVLSARLCSIVPFEGYLPYDRSGDWLYQTVEAISLLLAGTIVFMCRRRFASTYDPTTDTLNHLWLIFPALVLSLIFHPSLNAWMPADIAWTFALYLESFSCLPQLFLFQREGKVQPFTTHFLAGQALSKFLSFIFWFSSYSELNDPTKGLKSYVGIWVIVMQFLQLIVMGDFIWHYLRCISKGVPVAFILNDEV